jgi:hypothetical protein
VNKYDAVKISQSGITYGQIRSMLKRAYDYGAANDDRSTINPILSRASAFNIFWAGFRSHADTDMVRGVNEIGVSNALREFGEYWEGYRPDSNPRMKATGEYHREPVINIYQ